jgi:segregation and condensation protein B
MMATPEPGLEPETETLQMTSWQISPLEISSATEPETELELQPTLEVSLNLEEIEERPAAMSNKPTDSQENDVIAPEAIEASHAVETLESGAEIESTEETESLEAAAQDWLPDAEESASEDAEASTDEALEIAASPATIGSEAPITFVMDPYGIQTLSVADAQNQEFDPAVFAENDSDEEALETAENDSDEEALETAENDSDEEAPTAEASDANFDSIEDAEENEELAPLEFASIEETDGQLERLASALKAEEASLAEDTAAAEARAHEEAAQLLAAQIAEDEALAKQLAEEADVEEIDPELLAALPQPDENGNLDVQEMESCIEALLFMLDKPVSAQKLQDLLTASEEAEKPPFSLIQEALTSIRSRYNKPWHGIELVEVAGGYQLRTKVGRAALARKLAKVSTQRLSSGAMETLAIIAYRQPVLKDEIDRVRGVDSSHFVRGLLDKKLIEISGRSDLPGRPMLYSTSKDFLELFGLKDLSALPPLQEIESMVPASQSSKDEDPRVVKMRELVNQMTTDPTRLAYNPREDEVILQEIKAKVSSISTTTPYLEEQKAIEKAVALAKAEGREIPDDLTLLLQKPEDKVASKSLMTDEIPQAMTADTSAPDLPEILDLGEAPAPESPAEI